MATKDTYKLPFDAEAVKLYTPPLIQFHTTYNNEKMNARSAFIPQPLFIIALLKHVSTKHKWYILIR